jgi:ABC-2 type transport system ATP-binding protein
VNLDAAGGSDGVALRFRDVSKCFRAGDRAIQALDKVSAEVHRGTVTGLIGPDAAGKTTLMRVVAGLLVPDAGQTLALGFDSAREPLAVQAALGYMPQRFGLYEDLTVQENLDLYADLHAVPASARPARYDELLHMTGLSGFTGRLAGRLSGGMKQKLGLACVLVHPPELLLLDEPTVGVDPVSRRELWAIVYRLVEDLHTTVLLSTAYLDEAERCSEVILIHAGKVLGQGPPADFTRRIQGRAFRVSAPGVTKRALQRRLERAPGVLDVVIQGAHVRVVTEQTADADVLSDDAPFAGCTVTPAAPRFEDAFIAMLSGVSSPPANAREDPRPAAQGHATEPVLAVQGLTRRFGDFTAVRNVSFTVRSGEVFGLLGANGAGKSTTFRMLCGLLPASEGTLTVAGVDLRHAAAQARRRIGYMAQKFSLYGDLSVVSNLRFFARSYGLRGATQRRRVGWALAEFELEAFADATSRDLPLGYRQRLALAAALMHEPEILFLDEPTSGVDPLGRREFWRRINALADNGVTVLVTTHFMEEAEYCDRLVVMARGQILAEGSSEDLKARWRSAENPEPNLEDAFVALITASESHDSVGDAA